ncbi:MAG: gliding motility protein GldM [Bacteroidetes bacterium]|nr:gliding motility protein GldM [Fibrella sp.]
MAGAKETPRQKMIGMMYLVLTALLALQVTSAILEKFVLLNNSVEQSVSASSQINQKTLENIRTTVQKSGSRPADVAIIKQADDVRKMTADVIAEIDGLKQQIITEAGGGTDESGNIKNLSEEEKVAQIMVGATRNGKAYPLKNNLNVFTDNLSKIANAKYTSLAMDGKDDPIAARSVEQRRKDFAELNFAQTPVPAALAVLSQKQADVRRIEGQTLDYLASKVGAQDVKFDKILAMLSMESKVVVAGTKFKGQMFLAASSSGVSPRMSLSGGPVRVVDGTGMIEFTAQGGSYDKNGLARRVLAGSISYTSPNGEAKTATFNQEYFVAKPSYQIETGTLPPMYLGCANKLSIQSPQLGALWNPTFSASGAEVLQGGGKGKITVVPNLAQVSININNAGSLLGTETFRVNKVPKPTLEYYAGGTKVDERRGMSAAQVRSIRVVAVPDESFKNFNPEDARYQVTGMTVNLARGNRRVGSVTLSGAGGSIGSLAQEAQPGDRYIIEVEGVRRQNFKGDVSEVQMGRPIYPIPLN